MRSESVPLCLLISRGEIRSHLVDLLQRNDQLPMACVSLEDLLTALKEKADVIVFLDDETVRVYGPGIYAKIKVAGKKSKIVLLCDQAHRDLIKEAMIHGAYGCILEPYAEWEIMTIVRHIIADIQSTKLKSLKRDKPARGKPLETR